MVDHSSVDKFKASLRGELLGPGDAGYDEARKIWNGMIDKRPALIARCAGVADVISCVNFARANNVLVAVRGGGHNIAGNAVCDGGLVIDLSRMKSVRVDPARRRARAGAVQEAGALQVGCHHRPPAGDSLAGSLPFIHQHVTSWLVGAVSGKARHYL